MQIDVNFDQSGSSLPTGFVTAVNYAINYIDSLFTNPITISINVGYGEVAHQTLGSGDLGASYANYTVQSYSSVRSALLTENAPGASTLPATSPLSGNALVTQAEAAALGLASISGTVGSVGFSSSVQWDFTPNT